MELPVRVACLLHDLGKGVTPAANWPAHHGHEDLGVPLVEAVCQRLRVPTECRDLAVMTTREHGNVGRALQLRANTMVKLLERCDAFRKPARFIQMLAATECDSRGRIGAQASYRDTPFPQRAHLEQALAAARAVDAGRLRAANNRPRFRSACIRHACMR
jgi:tRNA nucleotidyltransferase (CCA-adding enzyme)